MDEAVKSLEPNITAVNGAGGKSDEGTRDEQKAKKPPKPDEKEIQEDYLDSKKGNLRHFYGAFHEYNGKGLWQERTIGQTDNDLAEFMKAYRWRGSEVSASRVFGTRKLVQNAAMLNPAELDTAIEARRTIISLQNGRFDWERQEMSQHEREDLFTVQLPFPFIPKAQCPNFVQFLNTSLRVKDGSKPDDEMIATLLEAIGYSMTGRTDLRKAFWMIGPTGAGKGVILDLITNMMGSLAVWADLRQLGKDRFLAAQFVGKRVILASEVPAGSYIDDAAFKTLVGGRDRIIAERKGKDQYAFLPETKVWWAMNTAPRTNDKSGALVDRLHPIIFHHSIPADQRNPNLHALLRKEYPGIFALVMGNYRNLLKRGKLLLPKASERRLQEYKDENDREGAFVAETLERDPSAKISTGDLYTLYKQWCYDNGFVPLNKNSVAEEWRRFFSEDRKVNGITHWYGYRPKATINL